MRSRRTSRERKSTYLKARRDVLELKCLHVCSRYLLLCDDLFDRSTILIIKRITMMESVEFEVRLEVWTFHPKCDCD